MGWRVNPRLNPPISFLQPSFIHLSLAQCDSVLTSAGSHSSKCAYPIKGRETCTHTMCRGLELWLAIAAVHSLTALKALLFWLCDVCRFHRTFKHRPAEIWLDKKKINSTMYDTGSWPTDYNTTWTKRLWRILLFTYNIKKCSWVCLGERSRPCMSDGLPLLNSFYQRK